MDLAEPTITFRKSARAIYADYLVSTDNEGRNGAERRHVARFRVGYDKGGMNYFSGNTTPRSYSASLSRVTLSDWEHGTTESFTLFDGIGLGRSDEVARYSEKALKAFFEEAHAALADYLDDPRVARYFEVREVPA